MPFLPVELRLQLGLVTSSPSLEDIHQAAAAQGLNFDPHTLQLSPANTFEGRTFAGVKATRAKRTAAVKALQEL
jgi:hypothetical protein